MDKILIVFDDTIGEKKIWESEFMKKLVFNSAHYQISLIITSQSYMSVPKKIRENTSSILFFEIPNEKSLEQIYEEYPMNLKKKDWMIMYDYVMKEQFAFMILNTQNSRGKKVQNGFKEYLQI